MLGNKVLRKIFGPEKDEILISNLGYNSELCDLYRSLSIVRTIGSRRLRWAGHLARTGKTTNAYRILVGKRRARVIFTLAASKQFYFVPVALILIKMRQGNDIYERLKVTIFL
jgi:hypothetical protein